jgi:hypothetical protein
MFKQGGFNSSAVDAFRRAADCSFRGGNLKQAASTLEAAAKEMAVAKDAAGKTEGARLYAEAAGFLQEAGEAVRASDLKLRAAKLVEGFDKDLASRFVDECIMLFDGDEDKDVYSVDPLRKALTQQLALGRHASAMRTMDKLWRVWTRLNQPHNLFKVVLSRVVLLLAAGDPTAAQAEFDKHMNLDGFLQSNDCAAAEDLLAAYSASRVQCDERSPPPFSYPPPSPIHTHTHARATPHTHTRSSPPRADDANEETIKGVISKHSAFGYLEPGVTRVAKGLAAAAAMGSRVGVAGGDEVATAALDPSDAPAVVKTADGFVFRQIGGGSGGGGGGGGGGGAADAEATRRAEAAATKEAQQRAARFGQGGGGGGGGGGGVRKAAANPAPEEKEEGEEAGPVVRGRGGGGGGGGASKAPAAAPAEPPAPAPTASVWDDDDDDGPVLKRKPVAKKVAAPEPAPQPAEDGAETGFGGGEELEEALRGVMEGAAEGTAAPPEDDDDGVC